MSELDRKLQRARNEMIAERFGRIQRGEDKNAIPERPMCNRPLMPNIAELSGEHRGEKQNG